MTVHNGSTGNGNAGKESVTVTPVLVRWMRRGTDEGDPARGVWHLRGTAHYVTYVEERNEAAGRATEVRTTLRVGDGTLTIIRHGGIRWNHTFQSGHKHASTMYVGDFPFQVETNTHHLDTTIRPYGGTVELRYGMEIGGHHEEVDLKIEFTEESTFREIRQKH